MRHKATIPIEQVTCNLVLFLILLLIKFSEQPVSIDMVYLMGILLNAVFIIAQAKQPGEPAKTIVCMVDYIAVEWLHLHIVF